VIEAVENHMPEVIIIDEIGTELEAIAARTIAEKGVQLVGTTHGNCLENLIKNPSLSDLIGGIQYVTLSDDEAKRRGTQKSVLERKAYPAFQIVIEINEPNSWTIHENVKNSIDLILRGNYSFCQIRRLSTNEKTYIKYHKIKNHSISSLKNHNKSNFENWTNLIQKSKLKLHNIETKKLLIYTYSLSNNLIKEATHNLDLTIFLTKEIEQADIILGLKKHLKQNVKLKKLAKQNNIPIYIINQPTIYQVIKLFQSLLY